MSEIEARFSVDDDWKARVQREREEARAKMAPAGNRAEPAPTPAPPMPDRDQSEYDDAAVLEDMDMPMSAAPGNEADASMEPDPSFDALVNMLATQAMYFLGFIGAPGQSQMVVNLEQAKEMVDMILMFRDKTRGNLSPSEQAIMTETVSEVQRLFAARVQQAQMQAMQQAGIDPANLRGMPQ